ncbi:MAG: NADH-quinone oxidoreductase subunit NuoF [Anaerolineae bacterium]
MNADQALEEILTKYASQGQGGLLPLLEKAQSIHGYLPGEVLARVGETLRLPFSHVYGVADFYDMLYTEPKGKKVIRLCQDVPCYLAGSDSTLAAIKKTLQLEIGETTPDGQFTLESAPCLGCCDLAPAMMINDTLYRNVKPKKAKDILAGTVKAKDGKGTAIRQEDEEMILLKHIGLPDLHKIGVYVEHGGFQALRKALLEMNPSQIVEEIRASRLVGRGGAAFPTGLKWQFTAAAPGDIKYVICNADESEPGTFKDRVLLERNPLQTIEAMTIAAYAIGAHQGYIYIRGEYPLAYERLEEAVQQANQGGYLGEDILKSGFSFQIEIRRGAGAYVCGEETALFESIEGKRGEPRVKPPFPTTHGLWGRPTVINNVETLANVPSIVLNGGSWYRRFGTEKSSGTKLFCLSGRVQRPGLYEVPLGVPLRHLLHDLAGGVKGDRALQAVLIGGAAGMFLTPDQLDLPLDFQSLAAAGATLGSGAVIVFDETVNLGEVIKRLARFFAHESCGKCYPCQLGTRRQLEIVERLAAGQGGDVQLLRELGRTMQDASLCGLGQTAANPVLSALEKGLVG